MKTLARLAILAAAVALAWQLGYEDGVAQR
jgi:hypothetical protein